MKMTEIVSFMDLSVYPSIALIFFLAAFIAVVWKALSTSKEEIDFQASLPLTEDVVVQPRGSFAKGDSDSHNTDNTDKGATRA